MSAQIYLLYGIYGHCRNTIVAHWELFYWWTLRSISAEAHHQHLSSNYGGIFRHDLIQDVSPLLDVRFPFTRKWYVHRCPWDSIHLWSNTSYFSFLFKLMLHASFRQCLVAHDHCNNTVLVQSTRESGYLIYSGLQCTAWFTRRWAIAPKIRLPR
jgi:hypothetical protein